MPIVKIVPMPGPQGPEGPAGSGDGEGIPGPAGEDGKSAYEIAVDNGFEGTEEDWLESFLGVDTSFEVNGGTLGTQPTFDGNPLFTGSYVKHGPLVHFRIDIDFDNITSFGTGQYYIDLPIPSKYNYEFTAGCLHDISVPRDYPISGHVFAGESRMLLKSIDAQGNTAFAVPFTATSPVTLTVEDNFHISGDYIALIGS